LGRIAVFASRNPGKLRELRALLPDWDIVPLGDVQMPEETGASFYENAAAKARFARSLEPGCWAIGEDSGLEVDGLGGAPGIRSARYAGESAGDEENVPLLLAAVAELGDEWKRAHSHRAAATGDLLARIGEPPQEV
jgi:XTP/dITP diphosphohydrolase